MALDTVQAIIARVNDSLVDDLFTRWPKEDLLQYYNDANKAIVLIRPDAFVEEISFSCDAGTKQAIPQAALRLVDIQYNSVSGMAVIRKARSEITEYDPHWYGSTGEPQAEYFIYDERNPSRFFVYPGVSGGTKIQMVYSISPPETGISNIDTAPSVLDAIYTNAIVEYMLYKAHSKDFEYSEQQRASMHYQMFRTILNAKSEAEVGMTPTNKD